MCGICGLWFPFNEKNEDIIYGLKSISRKLIHRGPDDFGIWTEPKHALGLAHRRLSIIDTSINGHQPMRSQEGRFIITFNGEIYNHKEIKKKIEKKRKSKNFWKGHSDTEVLLESIEEFGLENTLNSIHGMFAFALWDNKEKELILARDRFGEKPLYWGFANNQNDGQRNIFIFASEISGIFNLKGFQKSINFESLSHYFQYGYINQPKTIQRDIYQLSPGEILRISSNDKGLFNKKNLTKYIWWDSQKTFQGISNSKQYSDNKKEDIYIEELEKILQKAINLQANSSDMPVGCLLSGGIDSSLITTLLQKESSKPINSYTLKFLENNGDFSSFDESIYANQIASHLKTNHTEVILDAKKIIEIIPKIGEVFSEPFSDASQVPTYIISKRIKEEGISVVLSGDGGDEFFGGYNRHKFIPMIHSYFGWMPSKLRNSLSDYLLLMPFKKGGMNQDQIQKISRSIIFSNNPSLIYESIKSLEKPRINQKYFGNNFQNKKNEFPKCKSLEENIMLADILSYLPDDILVKLDRCSMATSLEARVPFLDKSLAEFAWKLPINMKIKKRHVKSTSKWILREILYKYIPREIIDRPKKGFTMPLGPWMRGSLKPWMMDLLDNGKIKNQGFLDPKFVENIVDEHISEKKDNSLKIWNILMWQIWLDKWY